MVFTIDVYPIYLKYSNTFVLIMIFVEVHNLSKFQE